MNISKLTDDLSVSTQVYVKDLPKIKDLGFQSIIINRPDDEGVDQPHHLKLHNAAQAIGLAAHYIPVVPGQINNDSVSAFGSALNAQPGPSLAFCKSGMRSRALWKQHISEQENTPSGWARLAQAIKAKLSTRTP